MTDLFGKQWIEAVPSVVIFWSYCMAVGVIAAIIVGGLT